MYRLHISPGAKEDISELKEIDPDAAATVLVLLQEIKGDQDILDTLTIHEWESVLPESGLNYEIKKWWEHYKKGKDLWRIKVAESVIARYRIIYGYAQREHAYYALAIVNRDFAYEYGHPITQRVLREYCDLCTH